MTTEERIAKCIGYCRFLQSHGVVWRSSETGSQAIGMVAAEWVVHCLTGLFDRLDDHPYIVADCECASCMAELERVSTGDCAKAENERLRAALGQIATGHLSDHGLTLIGDELLTEEERIARAALAKEPTEPCTHSNYKDVGGCAEGCCDYYECSDCGFRWTVEYD